MDAPPVQAAAPPPPVGSPSNPWPAPWNRNVSEGIRAQLDRYDQMYGFPTTGEQVTNQFWNGRPPNFPQQPPPLMDDSGRGFDPRFQFKSSPPPKRKK